MKIKNNALWWVIVIGFQKLVLDVGRYFPNIIIKITIGTKFACHLYNFRDSANCESIEKLPYYSENHACCILK